MSLSARRLRFYLLPIDYNSVTLTRNVNAKTVLGETPSRCRRYRSGCQRLFRGAPGALQATADSADTAATAAQTAAELIDTASELRTLLTGSDIAIADGPNQVLILADTAAQDEVAEWTTLAAGVPEIIWEDPNSGLPVHGGTSPGGSTVNTLVLAADANATNDYYRDCLVEIIRGTGKGQTRLVADYVGSTLTVYPDRAWSPAPDDTSVYKILPFSGILLADTGRPNCRRRCQYHIGGLCIDRPERLSWQYHLHFKFYG